MRIFVTGAAGYIGSVVSEKLQTVGHHVAGLARSEKSAQKLERLGAEVVRGDLRDTARIVQAARGSDAVIHLAMELSAEAPQLDRGLIEAALSALHSSGKPFLYTSGIWVMGDTGGRVADETTPVHPPAAVAWRPAHEQLVLRAEGLRGIVIRPAMVYGRGAGFVAELMGPDEHGVVRYIGSGENRWPFVHVDDLADLYVLALEAAAGSLYFASTGPSIAVKDVARAAAGGSPIEAIPLEEARKSMGPLADALILDQLISAQKAMRELGWNPYRPPVPEELAQRG